MFQLHFIPTRFMLFSLICTDFLNKMNSKKIVESLAFIKYNDLNKDLQIHLMRSMNLVTRIVYSLINYSLKSTLLLMYTCTYMNLIDSV